MKTMNWNEVAETLRGLVRAYDKGTPTRSDTEAAIDLCERMARGELVERSAEPKDAAAEREHCKQVMREMARDIDEPVIEEYFDHPSVQRFLNRLIQERAAAVEQYKQSLQRPLEEAAEREAEERHCANSLKAHFSKGRDKGRYSRTDGTWPADMDWLLQERAAAAESGYKHGREESAARIAELELVYAYYERLHDGHNADVFALCPTAPKAFVDVDAALTARGRK